MAKPLPPALRPKRGGKSESRNGRSSRMLQPMAPKQSNSSLSSGNNPPMKRAQPDHSKAK